MPAMRRAGSFAVASMLHPCVVLSCVLLYMATIELDAQWMMGPGCCSCLTRGRDLGRSETEDKHQ